MTWSWYTGHWWLGCYIWYSEQGTVDFNDVQNKHFVASSIKHLFENVKAQNIIDFIKETRFYKQL